MATHSSILAWIVPWTEESGELTVHGVTKSWTRLSDLERCWKAQWWKWLGNFIIGSEGTSPADSASCLSPIPASSSLSQAACWATGYCEKSFCKESLQVTLPKPWDQKSTATSLGWKTSACLGNIGSLVGVECGFVCTLWTGVGACWWAWGHHVWVSVRLSL